MKKTVEELKQIAIDRRIDVLTMIHKAQSGHPGGALSCTDAIVAVYYGEMNIDPNNPKWDDRDRFVLSKGHVAPIQYAVLADLGFVPKETIYTLRQYGSPFQGHPDMKKLPGIDISTGSLGQGLSAATGMALAGKRDKKDYRVFAMLGDGEMQEGQIWEAIMSAAHYHLDNLIAFVDNNQLQLDGYTWEVNDNHDFIKKFVAFGWDAYSVVDGNDMQQIVDVLEQIRYQDNGKPKAIILNTKKGRGVSFMEDVCDWHGKAPNDEQYAQAVEELKGGLK
ncbi:MAG: transketolase [Tissierellia bacterium]|jgi:transketolase|nr:transketolase [Bacillota bacterium]NLK59107.1 transketolase [Tissierellia bacterium]